jgi:hypothetical protein
LVELSNTGSQLLHATYVGGSDEDIATAVAIQPNGEVLVAGNTLSTDLVTTPGAYDRSFDMPAGGGGEHDMFVQRCGTDLAKLDYSTYFGGPGDDRVAACELDASGAVLLAGTTVGPNFPVSVGAFQPSWNINAIEQGFAARLELLLHPIGYGSPKLNSGGSFATIRWEGFPSVSEADFRVGVDLALPNQWCYVFRGVQPANLPFVGGRLAHPPAALALPALQERLHRLRNPFDPARALDGRPHALLPGLLRGPERSARRLADRCVERARLSVTAVSAS